jgi:hypothetical protein
MMWMVSDRAKLEFALLLFAQNLEASPQCAYLAESCGAVEVGTYHLALTKQQGDREFHQVCVTF